MKREQKIQKRSLRVSSEAIRTLSTSQLVEAAGGGLTAFPLPSVCNACKN